MRSEGYYDSDKIICEVVNNPSIKPDIFPDLPCEGIHEMGPHPSAYFVQFNNPELKKSGVVLYSLEEILTEFTVPLSPPPFVQVKPIAEYIGEALLEKDSSESALFKTQIREKIKSARNVVFAALFVLSVAWGGKFALEAMTGHPQTSSVQKDVLSDDSPILVLNSLNPQGVAQVGFGTTIQGKVFDNNCQLELGNAGNVETKLFSTQGTVSTEQQNGNQVYDFKAQSHSLLALTSVGSASPSEMYSVLCTQQKAETGAMLLVTRYNSKN